MIAAREYDDANEWVRIAEANDLDDPREIAPGDWLMLPPIENPEWNWRRSLGTTATSTRRRSPCASGATTSMRDLLVAVSQVEVDLVLGAASRFSFTRHRLLQPQARTRSRPAAATTCSSCSPSAPRSRSAWATATPSRRRLLVSGTITEITTSFPEAGSPELAVAGYDHGFPLTHGQELAHLDESARQRRGARDRQLPQPQRRDRDDEGEARADRTEPGKRLGVPQEAGRPQSLRALRRRAQRRCISASRTTRRRQWSGSCGAKGC